MKIETKWKEYFDKLKSAELERDQVIRSVRDARAQLKLGCSRKIEFKVHDQQIRVKEEWIGQQFEIDNIRTTNMKEKSKKRLECAERQDESASEKF